MTDLAIGLMSGTSLDGIDAALVRIQSHHDIALVAFQTTPFDTRFRRAILDTMAGGSVRDVARLHADLGARFADASHTLLEQAGIPASAVAFCASHGLTLWHEPRRVTLQIGDPAVIAERLAMRVVSDFRSRDVAAGGEGAPLVPMADMMLFGHRERARVLLNVGGMANLTLVPRLGSSDGLIAFDTGPGVSVCDAVVRNGTGHPFDRDGKLAAEGQPVSGVANAMLEHPYFSRNPPKSTGREVFGDQFAARLIDRTREAKPDASTADCAATALLVTCRAIGRAIEQWVGQADEIVVSGGGARNPALLALLEQELGGRAVHRFDRLFFDGDAKEAAAFAYLGWLTLAGEPGNLPAVTGAGGARILGNVTPA